MEEVQMNVVAVLGKLESDDERECDE